MKIKSALLSTAITFRAFMSDVCETVQIKDAKGNPVTINKSEYNEGEHGPLWKPTKAAVARQEKQAEADAPNNTLNDAHDLTEEMTKFNERIEELNLHFGVFDEGSKFFVCDSRISPPVVITDLIDPETEESVFDVKGYRSQKKAWDAVQDVRSRNTSKLPGSTTVQLPPEGDNK